MTNRNSRMLLGLRIVSVNLAWTCVLFLYGVGPRCTSVNAQDRVAQPRFKNLQELKDIPSEHLLPAMEFISASLGVQCEFCHVRDAFDKDDKQTKQTARRMIHMMFDLNANQFHGERAVTCYTCHRGSPRPISIPMVDSTAHYVSEARTAAVQAAEGRPDLPSPHDVLEKYIQAVGGAAAIQSVSSRVESGTVTFGAGASFPIEILAKSPSRQALIVHMPAGDNSTVVDSQNGWFRSAAGPVRDLSKADTEDAKLDADLQFPIHVSKSFQRLRVMGTEKVGGHDAILLFATHSSDAPLELYFDRLTGLLLRQLRFGTSPLGLNPTQIDYGDYKPFDGVQVPLHVVITQPNRTMDIHLMQVSQNVPIDDAKFAHP
jgi:photosynthetic reaction center cytochrome c subunit